MKRTQRKKLNSEKDPETDSYSSDDSQPDKFYQDAKIARGVGEEKETIIKLDTSESTTSSSTFTISASNIDETAALNKTQTLTLKRKRNDEVSNSKSSFLRSSISSFPMGASQTGPLASTSRMFLSSSSASISSIASDLDRANAINNFKSPLISLMAEAGPNLKFKHLAKILIELANFKNEHISNLVYEGRVDQNYLKKLCLFTLNLLEKAKVIDEGQVKALDSFKVNRLFILNNIPEAALEKSQERMTYYKSKLDKPKLFWETIDNFLNYICNTFSKNVQSRDAILSNALESIRNSKVFLTLLTHLSPDRQSAYQEIFRSTANSFLLKETALESHTRIGNTR